MSNYSLSFGIKLTHDLDDRFNLTRKTVLSQRDVPGMTRGLIPILVENGVKAISEGSNGRVFPGRAPGAKVRRQVAQFGAAHLLSRHAPLHQCSQRPAGVCLAGCRVGARDYWPLACLRLWPAARGQGALASWS